MQIPRGFIVLIASVLAAIVNELLSWGLVYRTDHYKRLKQNLLQAEKRLEVWCALLRFPPSVQPIKDFGGLQLLIKLIRSFPHLRIHAATMY